MAMRGLFVVVLFALAGCEPERPPAPPGCYLVVDVGFMDNRVVFGSCSSLRQAMDEFTSAEGSSWEVGGFADEHHQHPRTIVFVRATVQEICFRETGGSDGD